MVVLKFIGIRDETSYWIIDSIINLYGMVMQST